MISSAVIRLYPVQYPSFDFPSKPLAGSNTPPGAEKIKTLMGHGSNLIKADQACFKTKFFGPLKVRIVKNSRLFSPELDAKSLNGSSLFQVG
ncbi:hypothetical protein M3027_16520 [Geoalkalibacter halelectricus]|nr:hypothetical protein [Geoalkalibacter halelectricus]